MNKLFTKIAALSVGLAMAVGVGVAVASNGREATPVHAAEEVYAEAVFTSANQPNNSSYTGSFTNTTNSFSWTVAAFNNNNNGWSGVVKCGRKNNASVASITTAASVPVKITKASINFTAITTSNVNSVKLYGGASGTTELGSFTLGTGTKEVTIAAASQSTGQIYKFEFDCKSASGNGFVAIDSVKLYYNASTPLTGITLGGAASQNSMSIGSSDLTAKTVSVTLNPSGATDQKVNIAHQSGTSGLFTVSSSATCTSGSGSFTVTGKGNTSGSETFRISGNTETSVYVDLVVTALDDSVTYWTVSFDTDGGSATINDMTVENGDTFEFPSPGTKEHYTFDGWSADAEHFYDEGDTSPVVDDDIEYLAFWTEDAKYTVTYVAGDHGDGDNYVVNNVYGGSYTLATFATAGFSADSGYAFKKWSVGGVEYAEGATVTISGTTTVTAVYKTVEEYALFSGSLVEGDYVICSGTKAMKNETTSAPRIDVADVTVTNNKIVDPDASIIWHIAQDGDYWTIYNAAVEKYAAFTGTNGRGTLIDSITDYARFSTDDAYEFINVGNSGKYLRYNATYGFASYAASTGVTLTLYKAPSNELSSIALSGEYKTSFASGDTFSFGGTVTANYTIAAAANVTSSTTFHLDSANGTNMSGVTMTHAAHDGHTIYAKYTENDITKTATYSISVANAPVSSVSIGTHAAEIGLKEDYVVSGIASTVLPADAVQTTEWVTASNTVSNDFTFNGTKLTAGQTEGTVTLRCRSTADNSKYDELVVTISGDPTAAFAKDSTTGFAGKSETVSFTYGNFDAGDIAIESGNNSYVTIGTISASEGNGTVVINFVAAGSTSVTIGDGNSVLDTLTVTVSADSVTSVTWSASDIDVFSGATLSTAGWNVQYEMASGDTGSAESYTIKLGSATVTAGYEFQGADNGKTLHVEYGGVSSSSVNVVVTQTINNVNAETFSSDVSTLTFAAQCSGSGTADDGKGWTVESDGSESNFDNTKGIHYGTGKAAVQYIRLSSSDFTSGTITKVVVNASTASGVSATLAVRVGGNAFGGNAKTISSSATPYTFNGSASADDIEVEITKAESATGALYCLSIEVTYETSDGTQQIANVAAHKAAQRVAVKFANAFNTAMGTTANCTENMESAWATCSSAYNTFKSEAAALGEAEEAYAKNLIKYATLKEEWQQDYALEDCIEKMVRVYKVCVESHGQTAFMNDLRPLQSRANIGFGVAMDSSSTSTIVIISALTGLAAIGGYFFLRKRKVQ